MISATNVVQRMKRELIGSVVRTDTDSLVISTLIQEAEGWPLPLVIGCDDPEHNVHRRWRTVLDASGMSSLTDDEAAQLFASIIRVFLDELLVTGGPVADLEEIRDLT